MARARQGRESWVWQGGAGAGSAQVRNRYAGELERTSWRKFHTSWQKNRTLHETERKHEVPEVIWSRCDAIGEVGEEPSEPLT